MINDLLLSIFGMGGTVTIGLLCWILLTSIKTQKEVAVLHNEISGNKALTNNRFENLERRVIKVEEKLA